MIRRNGISDTATIGSVTIGASENHIGQIGGSTKKIYAEFTRQANTTAYIANDVVSPNATNTGGVTLPVVARIAQGNGYITGVRIVTDNAETTGVQFRVHFGMLSTAFAETTDNSPFGLTYLKSSNQAYLGYIDLAATTTQGGSSIAYIQDIAQRFPFMCEAADANLYFIIETLTGFTPASGQKFSLHIFAEQN